MPLGHVLYEPGDTLSHVYFPTTAIISLLYVMKNGESAEIAVVGNEGLVGVSLFMGGGSTSSRAVVQSAGGAYRLEVKLLQQEFDRSGPVLHLLLRYTQALMTQMVQTAACNKHHSLDQQLCRWLLLSLDRLQGTQMLMTPTLIANMLGVAANVAAEGALKHATCEIDPVRERPHSRDGSRRARTALLRMLRGRQKRIRSTAGVAARCIMQMWNRSREASR